MYLGDISKLTVVPLFEMQTTAFDNGVAGHEFWVRVKSSGFCLVWLSWRPSGEMDCLKASRAEIPEKRSTELSGWKTVRAWPRAVAEGERGQMRNTICLPFWSLTWHTVRHEEFNKCLLDGRINTDWLIIDGGEEDVWKKLRAWYKHDTSTLGRRQWEEYRAGNDHGRRSDEVCLVHARLEAGWT